MFRIKVITIFIAVLSLFFGFIAYYPDRQNQTISTVQAAGEVATYSFNEGSGTFAVDTSGNSRNGTLTNGPTWTTGKYNSAINFDGVNDNVTLPTSLDISSLPFSVEAWINPANYSDWHAIFTKRSSYTALAMRFDVGMSITSGNIYITQPNSNLTFSYTPPLNTWTHIAVVVDSTGTRLYVNGILQQTLGVFTLGTGASAPVMIGNNGDADDPFAGKIDEVRIYSRALSQSEIQTDMNTPIGGTPTPDTQFPTTPTNLSATAVSSSQINLSWTASTDNIGVTGYRVERCQGSTCTTFSQISTPTATSYSDTGLSANTTYRYQVRATDAAGNVSTQSTSASATTQAQSSQSALAQLAASVQPGEWRELITNGFDKTFLSDTNDPGDTSSNIFLYTDDAHWDSVARQVLFRGEGVYQRTGKFVAYSDATNTWRVVATAGGPYDVGHNYDHTAISVTRRTFYDIEAAVGGGDGSTIHKYNIDADTWGNIPSIPTGTRHCDAGALVYHEAYDRLIYTDACIGVWAFSPATSQWSQLSGVQADMNYHSYAKYSAKHQVVIFGGGNDRRSVYRLDASGVITRMKDAPVNLGIMWGSIITTDPVSGDFLVLSSSNQFYSYNPISDTWVLLANNPPIFGFGTSSLSSIAGTVATSIISYGVTMFMSWNYNGNPKVYLYKHTSAAVPSDPDTQAPSVPSNLVATAISSFQINLTWTASTDNVGVTGYRLERCQGSTCTNFSANCKFIFRHRSFCQHNLSLSSQSY